MICLIIYQANIGQDRRDKSFLSGILESSRNKMYTIGPIGDRPGKIWLGSSAISNFWPYIVTGLSTTYRTYYISVYVGTSKYT